MLVDWFRWLVFSITTNSREILLVCLELFIFPYHEIDILTWRRGGEGGKVMRDSVLCEDLLVQDFNINPSLSSPEISLLLVVTLNTLLYCIECSVVMSIQSIYS